MAVSPFRRFVKLRFQHPPASHLARKFSRTSRFSHPAFPEFLRPFASGAEVQSVGEHGVSMDATPGLAEAPAVMEEIHASEGDQVVGGDDLPASVRKECDEGAAWGGLGGGGLLG